MSNWLALRELNPRPNDYESPALTTELRANENFVWATVNASRRSLLEAVAVLSTNI